MSMHVDAIEDDSIRNDFERRLCLGVVAPLDQRPPAFLRDAVNVKKLQPVIVRPGCGLQDRRVLVSTANASQTGQSIQLCVRPGKPRWNQTDAISWQYVVRRIRSNEDRRRVGATFGWKNKIADERFAGP